MNAGELTEAVVICQKLWCLPEAAEKCQKAEAVVKCQKLWRYVRISSEFFNYRFPAELLSD